MKIFQLLLITGLLLATPIISVAAQENITQSVTIQVNGLSCPFCTYGLEKHLKKIKGVESVEIDIKRGKVTVNLKQGVQINDAVLNKAVKKAGFTARAITHQ